MNTPIEGLLSIRRNSYPKFEDLPSKLFPTLAIFTLILLTMTALSMGQDRRGSANEHRPTYSLRGDAPGNLRIVQNSFSPNLGLPDIPRAAAQSGEGIEPLPGRVLISFQQGITDLEKQSILNGISPSLQLDRNTTSPFFNVVQIGQDNLAVQEAIARLRVDPRVRLAEPDYRVYALDTIPNDPSFSNLWGLRNTGQGTYGSTSCTTCSKPGADISAVKAWDTTTGSDSVIVAVIDSGVDYSHPDLAANILRDASDKVIGFDFVNNDDDPMDDFGHGTHCSGIIGAVGNNGIGIAGVSWKVKIMPIKFLNSSGSGSTSNAVQAIDFAVANGAQILSNSWGGGGNSQLLLEAIRRAEQAGVLFVASAGNSAVNIDSGGFYPAGYNQSASNVIAVAATDAYDQLAYFSNYGPKTCDIAAPGYQIYSTLPSGPCPLCNSSGYGSMSGTSMAAPYVAGAAALIRSAFPQISLTKLKSRLLYSADRPVEMDGYTRWGRLNLNIAMQSDVIPPASLSNFTISKASGSGLRLTWTASGDNGTEGTASAYQIFYGTDPDVATAAMIEPGFHPASPGIAETYELAGLMPDTAYYVFVRAVDKVGNTSSLAYAGPVKTNSVEFSDGAEGAPIFYTVSGVPWSTTSEEVHTGRYSYVSPAYTSGVQISSVRMVNSISVSGPMYIAFWLKMDLADTDFLIPTILNSSTGLSMSLSTYNGSAPWRRYRVDLSEYAGSSVSLGFTLYTGAGTAPTTVSHRVWIDDISIVKLSKGWEDNVEGAPQFSGFAPWSITTESSSSPTHAWSDSPNSNYKQNVRLPLIQTSSATLPESLGAPSLVFRSKFDLEEDRDYLEVYGSQDDGANWEYIGVLTGKSAWTIRSFALPGWKKVRVMFFLTTNEAVAKDGVYLDDIGIWGEPFTTAASAAVSEVNLNLLSGGIDSTSSLGPLGNLSAGYATVSASTGSVPYGTAVYSYTKEGVVQFEAGVPTTPPTKAARFFVEIRSSGASDSGGVGVDTGLAVANVGDSPSDLTLKLRDADGNVLSQGGLSLNPGEYRAKMLNQLGPGFVLPSGFDGLGTLEITSTQPVSIFASRVVINQAGGFLVSNSPVADLSSPVSSGTLSFPQIVDGGGYQATFILINTSSTQESGTLLFYDKNGAAFPVRMKGSASSSSQYSYSIAPGGFLRLVTDGVPASMNAGWAQVIPQSNSSTPSAAALLALTQGGVLVTEAGYPAAVLTTHARIYVDMSNGHDTGVAVCNPGGSAIRVNAEAFQSNGSSHVGNGSGFIDLAANGQDAKFAGGIIPGLPAEFVGVLNISSSFPFSAMTVRSLFSGGNFLVTAFPVADINASPPSPVVFPQIANGGGYQTQILLLSPGGGDSKVTVRYYDDQGAPLKIGK